MLEIVAVCAFCIVLHAARRAVLPGNSPCRRCAAFCSPHHGLYQCEVCGHLRSGNRRRAFAVVVVLHWLQLCICLRYCEQSAAPCCPICHSGHRCCVEVE